MGKNNRIWSMELVRLFACLCICMVHFNASVSGWNSTGGFTYPNSIVPNFYLEGRIYLGGIGTSLFFMLTGASLMLSYREGNLKQYYKKRFLGIYPMFWIAYGAAFALDFLKWKCVPPGNIKLMVFSVLGMDGYLGMLGLLQTPFYKLGEWFLGAIVSLYIFFPLIHWCLQRKPAAFSVCVFAGYGGYLLLANRFGLPRQEHLFFLRIPEILLGMLFIKYDLRHKPKYLLGISTGIACVAVVLRRQISPLTLCVGVCTLLFALLICLGEKITNQKVQACMVKTAAMTYPVFLTHHWLIDRLSMGFDLANMAKRDVATFFLIYLLLALLLAQLLISVTRKITMWFSGEFPEKTSINTEKN